MPSVPDDSKNAEARPKETCIQAAVLLPHTGYYCLQPSRTEETFIQKPTQTYMDIICPNCHGKGHVMDGASALASCLSVVLIPLILFEANEPDGITRTKCDKCRGKGIITSPSSV